MSDWLVIALTVSVLVWPVLMTVRVRWIRIASFAWGNLIPTDNVPSKDWNRNSAWLHRALAASLNAWPRHLALVNSPEPNPKPCGSGY